MSLFRNLNLIGQYYLSNFHRLSSTLKKKKFIQIEICFVLTKLFIKMISGTAGISFHT